MIPDAHCHPSATFMLASLLLAKEVLVRQVPGAAAFGSSGEDAEISRKHQL